MSNNNNPVALIILDGWGIASPWGGNAIFLAKTPCFDVLWKKYPHVVLSASGESVGLSGHERGNSEAGHLNIGAGKIVHQDVNHIFNLIKNGDFFHNEILLNALNHVKKNKSTLHLFGLVSDGGIHSHIDQLFALLELCKQQSVENINIHAFTDGRDTEPQGALSHISSLEKKLKEFKAAKIATISGRYYAMDRDKHWDRTQAAYQAIASGLGLKEESAASAISKSYQKGLTDEFIYPTVISKSEVKDGDGIVFFNIRGDRARQLTLAFSDPKFGKIKTIKFKNLLFVTFTWYGDYIPNTQFAFPPEKVEEPLAKVLSDNGIAQFHTSETEKFAHVTYFFNGQKESPFKNEERKMIPSPRVATYDLKPEMSIREVADTVIDSVGKKTYGFILVNFANPDMVGHTGNLKAGIRAVEAVDLQLERVLQRTKEKGVTCLITADHGNIEQMVNPKTGDIDTEHTNNPVPFIIVAPNSQPHKLRGDGILADIAPTVLNILKIELPEKMTGKSLLI